MITSGAGSFANSLGSGHEASPSDLHGDIKLKDALKSFYRVNGFPENGGIDAEYWALEGCRDLKVYLPNFEWRRKAIPFHDLHHILTEYPFSPEGEFQIAAWEFAAGRYKNILTTLFCLPLIGLGAVWSLRKSFTAFVRGRNSQTLYEGFAYESVVERTLADVRQEILPSQEKPANRGEYLSYGLFVAASWLLILTPFISLFLLMKWIF